MKRSPRSHCPISLALEAVGDKWSLLILRDLILRKKGRYQEFLSSEEGISTNILADRLVRLEKLGLIFKSDDPDDKRQFRYFPTQKGLDLLPVIFAMARWSAKYDPHIDMASSFLRRMRTGNEGLMKEMLSQFRGTRQARATADKPRPLYR